MSKATEQLAKLQSVILVEKLSFMYKVLGMKEYVETLDLDDEQEEKFQAHFSSIYDFAHNVIAEINGSIQESYKDWDKDLIGEVEANE